MAAELQTIRLSAKDRELVEAYVELGDWDAVATKLGYKGSARNNLARTASQSPAILAAVHVEIGRRLVEGAAIGYRVLIDVAKGEAPTAAEKKLQLEAAKELLKLGGHVGPRAKSQENAGGKQLHEMSLEDLRKQRDALEQELVDRAKPVSAPNAPEDDSEAVDMLS